MVNDFDIADQCVFTRVAARAMHRLGVRARQNPQRPVGHRCFGNGDPQADRRRTVVRKIERVLMPRLAERAGQLEDELRQEAVDVVTEQRTNRFEHSRLHREAPERGLRAVHSEDFRQLRRQRFSRRDQRRFLHGVCVADRRARIDAIGHRLCGMQQFVGHGSFDEPFKHDKTVVRSNRRVAARSALFQ